LFFGTSHNFGILENMIWGFFLGFIVLSRIATILIHGYPLGGSLPICMLLDENQAQPHRSAKLTGLWFRDFQHLQGLGICFMNRFPSYLVDYLAQSLPKICPKSLSSPIVVPFVQSLGHAVAKQMSVPFLA
jgi:hypothetical protein